MSPKLNELLRVTEDEKKAILDYFNVTQGQFEDNVRQLKEWINKSAHLPKENNDNKLKLVLINSKMSVERAKQTVEGYYTVRTIYSDIFDNLCPSSDLYKKAKRLGKVVVMPKLTPNLCRVTFSKIEDPQGEAADGLIYQIMVLMISELRISNDCCLSNVIVVDFSEYGIKNLLKFTPSVNQKLVHILSSVKLRIESIHFLNSPQFLDRLMLLLKSFLPGQLVNKIHVHSNLESLHKMVPKECLPSDYGGYDKPLDELYSDWCEELEQREAYFNGLTCLKSTKKIDLVHHPNEVYGSGSEGSFKKLSID